MQQQQQQQQQPSGRRSACDRCRDHKLRCLRLQDQARETETCARCLRGGTTCVTGAPRPLGRRRVNGNTQRQRFRHAVFISVKVPKSSSQLSPASNPEPEAESSTKSTLDHKSLSTTSGSLVGFDNSLIADSQLFPVGMFFDEEGSSSKTPAPAVDALSLGLPNNTVALSDLVISPNSGALPMGPDLDEMESGQQLNSYPLPGLPDTDALGFSIDPAFQLRSVPGSALNIAHKSPELSLDPSNIVVRLAQLNERIVRQLSQINTLVLETPPLNLFHSCVDKVEDLQVNPILQALQSTRELAAIVKQVISPIQDHCSSPLNIPVVLMCLSGYIQLLQIYDFIFLQVHRILRGIHDIVGFFEDLPGFPHIRGLSPIPGDLYIKIMIQVTQHNISSVEQALGLPTELCLSARRTPSKSLFGYLGESRVFKSILEQACSPSERSGRALVTSLRTNIGNVLDLLRKDG